MIQSNFEKIKISGISCAVPTTKDIIKDKYANIFGEDTVQKFSKMTSVISRSITKINQTASDLSFEAAINLLNTKNISLESIGALVFVTQTPDYVLPATATVLHKRLNLSKNCVAFDVNLGCSGYVYGLQIVSSLMSSSSIDRALLLTGDTITKIYSNEDRTSCMLFGDAGSATLLEKVDVAPSMKMGFKTDGSGFKSIIVPAGAFRNIESSYEKTTRGDGNKRSDYDLFMNGTDVFNFTITEVPKLIKEFMEMTQTTPEDFDSFVMHQANSYILKQVAKRCKIPIEKMPISMDRYGNTSVTSIPLTLVDKYGKEADENIKTLMCGFGVGLSWGIVSATLNATDILPILETDEFYTEGEVSHD